MWRCSNTNVSIPIISVVSFKVLSMMLKVGKCGPPLLQDVPAANVVRIETRRSSELKALLLVLMPHVWMFKMLGGDERNFKKKKKT